MSSDDVEDRIHATFAATATSIGYNEVHGRIISALLVENKPLSLQELSRKTGYSLASISLSLDLLELVGIIRKSKQNRRIYAKIEGDILEGLRNAMLLKIQKNIIITLAEFEKYKSNKKAKKTITVLEKEIKRLQNYVDRLAEVKLPK